MVKHTLKPVVAGATLLTPDLSKAARRELSLTQNNVITETGIQAYKLKQFEAGRFRPEMACLKQLREFYEGHGVNFAELEAHMGQQHGAGRDAPGDDPPQVDHKRGLTATPRPGFFISEHLAQELIDRVLARMEENDDRIAELVEAAYERGMFGVSEATENKVRELFAAMAENHLLFRFLQGRNIIAAIREEPKTIGEFLGQWLQQSPAHDVFDAESGDQASKPAALRTRTSAQMPTETEEE